MRVDGKFICDAYGCNKIAFYRDYICGNPFEFCNAHKYNLNHSRAEVIVEMISSSRMSIDDILHTYNFNKTGFDKKYVINTVRSLKKSGIIILQDGFFYPGKVNGSCIFPGCNAMAKKSEFCHWHRNIDNIETVIRCINHVENGIMTRSDISKAENICLKSSTKILDALVSTGRLSRRKTNAGIQYYSKKNEADI